MQSPDAHRATTDQLLALSGVVFAVLFLVGWFASGANSPDYGASDEDWITPFLLAAAGFAALLLAAGVLTLRTGVFARWTGFVALIGAVSFLVTFAVLLQGTGEDSVFGYGFFPGVLALVIWSAATSVATYRALAATAR